ncbi:transposase [Neolewinella sp.]|uniref:transposase n=1 Tax=Neolewinella sp. TaxID=2993543 RepID=UPI003B51C05F
MHTLPPIFHIYNRATDRRTLFHSPENYVIFLKKMRRQLLPAADLLAYCVMPNHFHVLLCPKHPLVDGLPFTEKPLPRLPTDELSKAVQKWLMGYTKSYNLYYSMTGSRFCQHTRCKRHVGVRRGIDYIHNNPVAAGLVKHADEWGYSSWSEHAGFVDQGDAICNLSLVHQLHSFEQA